MVEVNEYIHYASIALTMACNAIGAGIGQGITGKHAIEAMNTQPEGADATRRTAILGMAFIETSAVFATVASLMLLFGQKATHNNYISLAQLGTAFAMCCSGLAVSIASAFPARAACYSTARQPFFTQKIVRLMLLSLSLIQTPVVFGFIVALLIQNQLSLVASFADGARLAAAGICVGIGSIGPTIGLALFAREVCLGVGINKKAYNQLLAFVFVTQAVIETPAIFSLVVAVILLFAKTTNTLVPLVAALCTGIGTLAPGISSGLTAAAACKQITLHPEHQGQLWRTCLFAQGFIESCAIYPTLLALILIFSL